MMAGKMGDARPRSCWGAEADDLRRKWCTLRGRVAGTGDICMAGWCFQLRIVKRKFRNPKPDFRFGSVTGFRGLALGAGVFACGGRES